MTIGVIVQARMSSTRLPGKVLMPLHGKPLLGHLVDGLRQARKVDTLLVATSTDPSDHPVEKFCQREAIACYRGPLEDVSARFLAAAQAHALDAFVRICGDSPVLDHRLVDKAVDLFRVGGADIVSNVAQRTFPKGQSVEVVSIEAFQRAVRDARTPEDREHVTRNMYALPGAFIIRSFESGRVCGGDNLSVDTPEDMKRMASLISRLDKPHWTYGWGKLLSLFQEAS